MQKPGGKYSAEETGRRARLGKRQVRFLYRPQKRERMEQFGNIILYNADCMEIMKTFPDKGFDLAIVDPPYGINVTKMSMGSGIGPFGDRNAKKLRNKRLSGSGKLKDRILNRMGCDWDIAPDGEYFDELFRVSKNQIIWGGNYFNLRPTRCFVIWDKEQSFLNFSACEYAWTSFDYPSKLYRFANRGFQSKDKSQKIHPTQKPVQLYKFLINNFGNPGDLILDTHLGSGSICIAAHDLGFDLTGIEIDKEYYNEAKKRLLNHQRQLKIFDANDIVMNKELELFEL